jgi:SOS-response transcriptional repressor LexA
MHPEYREGELILVDPAIEARHGDDVIARTPEGKATFKRLQVTPDGTFLIALNPSYPDRIIKAPADTHICGVVTASWMQRRKR